MTLQQRRKAWAAKETERLRLEKESEALREANQKEFREIARRKIVENAMLEQQMVCQTFFHASVRSCGMQLLFPADA